MIKRMCFTILAALTFAVALNAETDYSFHDIGTLQTKTSQAIALNNKGQILGWYSVDGSNEGKHFFVRNKNGEFYEVPRKDGSNCEINWRFLTDEGKVYGTTNANCALLYMWDQCNGFVKVGTLPGSEVTAINNSGQVLIKAVVDTENGKTYKRPAIWKNGQITKLYGLAGNIGIESEESYGLDMNNKGEVVGQSTVFMNYKNEIYKQVQAVKWVNGQRINLHNLVPKSTTSSAIAINDHGDVLIGQQLIRKDGQCITIEANKTADANYWFNDQNIVDKCGALITTGIAASNKMYADKDSIWLSFDSIISVNDSGEAIGNATTIYGESHAILLKPVSCK
jgi:uncharacterized membrane protein